MTSARSLLRIWLWATVVVLAGLLVWAFAPVLVFFALLTLGIGLLSALMIGLARSLQKTRAPPPPASKAGLPSTRTRGEGDASAT